MIRAFFIYAWILVATIPALVRSQREQAIVEAWEYRLGNRSAIEWVLDQHKEKKPKDPTIRAKFDSYRFVDHKERVIDLLARVTTVSVETAAITDAMRRASRAH